MARYRGYDYSLGKFIPIHFDNQILPGTFEHTLRYLIDNKTALMRDTEATKPERLRVAIRVESKPDISTLP